ncbi:MAG: hypothetical protein ACYDH6_24660 [Acidimicrobiales bacterium]
MIDRSEALDLLGSLLDMAERSRERNEPVLALAAEGIARALELKLFAGGRPERI